MRGKADPRGRDLICYQVYPSHFTGLNRNTEETETTHRNLARRIRAHIWQQKRAKKEGDWDLAQRLMCLSRSETGTVGSQRGKLQHLWVGGVWAVNWDIIGYGSNGCNQPHKLGKI